VAALALGKIISHKTTKTKPEGTKHITKQHLALATLLALHLELLARLHLLRLTLLTHKLVVPLRGLTWRMRRWGGTTYFSFSDVDSEARR
jgi:hypothetical protein